MSYLDLYKKRMLATGVSGMDARMNESIFASEVFFTQTAGYKRATLNFETEIDIVVESTLTPLEKKMHLRPSSEVNSGDYISYGGRTYIIRSVNYDKITPIAQAFFCNQTFRLPNVKEPILCYSNSTTYGNKGTVDVNSFSQLDSKTKIYVRKTDATNNIVLGTRIMFNNKYVYKITECDDVVFPGMFIMVAQREEGLVMDDYENNLAYNDDDKIKIPPVSNEEIPIIGLDRVKIGEEVTFVTESDVVWEIDGNEDVEIVKQNRRSITLIGIAPTWIVLFVSKDGVPRGKKEVMIYQ